MRNLNFELKQLCQRNRDGSYATQRDRERVLDLVADQLQELGCRSMAAANLKPKHVVRLVEHWRAEGLAVGTIKNRMAELRCGPRRSVNRMSSSAPMAITASVTGSTSPTSQGARVERLRAQPNHRPVHRDVAAAAGCIRSAARRIDQDPTRIGPTGATILR